MRENTPEGTRQFKGVWLPADVFLNNTLSPLEKILWADIDSFTMNQNGFHKSNETIAKQYGVSKRSVTTAIANLIGLDMVEAGYIGGRHRILQTTDRYVGSQDLRGRVAKSARQGGKICEAGSQNLLPRVPIENTIESTQLDIGDVPWHNNEFVEAWEEWLAYRKEAKLKTTPRSLKASITKLVKLSGGQESVAREIINESIANGWKGFFPLKNKAHEQQSFTADGLRQFIDEG